MQIGKGLAAVRRVYVAKKKEFDVEAQALFRDIKGILGITAVSGLRIVNRYDVAGVTDSEHDQAKQLVFAEANLDNVWDEELSLEPDETAFAVEYLPGQFDQRADSAAQCVQILTQRERPEISYARVIVLKGRISARDLDKVKEYFINPVETREARLDKPQTLTLDTVVPDEVETLEGFGSMSGEELKSFMQTLGLAMSLEDLVFCQSYFRDTEKREPSLTEIRVIDTYWSDHCRHTTFLTRVEEVSFAAGQGTEAMREAYDQYLAARVSVYGERTQEKNISLMDLALMAMKELKQQGRIPDLDESDEINACSIVVKAQVDGKEEEYLVMFKNETHNHPTEIEPFGGAATCLGGAIRDPLSGRTYVYQAMRVTGSGDPRARVEDTLPGKLPQRKITVGAADGYSSYGNQIGLATGQVAEVYDEGFIAKRMEIGAVIGAAPRRNVTRRAPAEGDLVILVGGRTGRDGCGGATGSSKEHNLESLTACGAEVQKGNAPTERKIQRLFRNPAASRMIIRCNDFGAGGVSVAVGELTAGLEIDLDAVPKKYEGLDGTELAISESQERMAVALSAADAQVFKDLAEAENLEATVIARVTGTRRLRMSWRGRVIVDLSRDFLDTNGVQQSTTVEVESPKSEDYFFAQSDGAADLEQAWLDNLTDLNVCGKKGLVEKFDSTIGAGTVLMPFGGRRQLTPAEGMVAKLPVPAGDTTTATAMTYGYNPKLAKWSPFHGGLYAIVEAVTKLVCLGGDYTQARLTLQEYFEKLGKDPVKWGKPFSALLGAFLAQKKLGIPAIGGKDSMSGSFMDLNVPPTLVAFALGTLDARQVVSQEFKRAGSQVALVSAPRDKNDLPEFEILQRNFRKIRELALSGKVLSARSVRAGGLAAGISEMALGNKIGMAFSVTLEDERLFAPDYGSVILELPESADLESAFGETEYTLLGFTQAEPRIKFNGVNISLDDVLRAWESPLKGIFPTGTEAPDLPVQVSSGARNLAKPRISCAKPRVFIPVFPGTNCEDDSARAFERAGGIVETMVIRNLTPAAIEESLAEMAKKINQAQIVMLPGGFSAGDEPEGSGKFIATMFRNPRIEAAVMELLKERDGLMLGICNGFQALIKLGLVPYGEIVPLREDSPTLTYNKIGRHVSCMVQTKVVSTLSPWFSAMELGEIHTVPVSHGEGRFVAGKEIIEELAQKGQIATQYVDSDGNPSSVTPFNPNGSIGAVEGITSPDGRVLGKMAHSERCGDNISANVPGNKCEPVFAGGINYYK